MLRILLLIGGAEASNALLPVTCYHVLPIKAIKTPKIVVFAITDGQTNNIKIEFNSSFQVFERKNIPINVIAVSNRNTNLENVTKNEEKNIPGMD